MMQAVWLRYPGVRATYQFINRRPDDRFSKACFEHFRDRVAAVRELGMTPAEGEFLRSQPYFQPAFVDFLTGFRMNPDHVQLEWDAGEIRMWIEGPWVETILWEVPLLALLSESYFIHDDTAWDHDLEHYGQRSREKGQRLTRGGCNFVDFGTRRRRSYQCHEALIRGFQGEEVTCAGTSNVHFARLYGYPPIGTMAHEWIMAHAALASVEQANARALEVWREVFGDQLDMALTDTYTTDLFLENFRGDLARRYGGVRHDSGDPMAFADRMIAFYQQKRLAPQEKKIVFSDSLNVERTLELEEYVKGRIQAAYGIGTHLTNDFPGSRALNIVIKLFAIDDQPVVKISDDRGKASGDPETVREVLQQIDAVTGGGQA